MKKLIMAIMFLVFSFTSANADCEYYNEKLVGQCVVTTVDETEFELCFGESVFGPCPSGVAILEYVENDELILLHFDYSTIPDYVTIAGLDFILVDHRLILMPEDPLIFEMLQK